MSQSYETFGKYILLEKFAMGGMAEIYLARNQGTSGVSKFFAIKRILPQFTEQIEFIDMFKDEAKIAINLSHANIVSIFEFGIERSQFYISMDYIEGKNLRQILNKMKKSGVTFSIEQVLYIVAEVAKGLDAAHRCIDSNTGKPLNIIHRDMSPQNIMISYEGEVKIVDFGIAKAETQLETTRAGTLKGKFGYMSPEQAEGQNVDLRTDIFAVGIVLWELLANDRLFVANNEVNTLRKIRDCQVPSLRKINPNIPQELERIVGKALAKDKNLRYQTSAAFHRELSRFLNRQFPDFSPHDFSVFVKTLFAAEILESRKKMVEFAKVEYVETPNNATDRLDKTIVTQTSSMTEESSTDPSVNFGEPLASRAARPAPPPSGTTNPTTTGAPQMGAKRPAAPDALVRNTSATTREISPRDEKIDTSGLKFDRTSFGNGPREGTFTNATYSGSRTFTRSSQGKSASSMTSTFLLIALFGTLIGAGGFYIINPSKANDSLRNVLTAAGLYKPPQNSPVIGGGVIDQGSTAPTIDLAVRSTPSGASIEVDGVIKQLTPASLRIDEGKTVRIRLILKGYVPWEGIVTLSGPQPPINAILQAERRGYLDINVVGAGEIFVDGQLIASSGPANGIQVPADKDVTVKVVDKATGASDATVIRVAENKVRRITLIPRAGGDKQPPSIR